MSRDAALEEHLDSIFERIPLGRLSDDSLPQDVELSFSIAAFFDDAMCSVYVESYWLELLALHEIQLEVSCYPSNFEE